MPTRDGGKWMTSQEEPYEVEPQVAEGFPSYLVRNQQTGHSWVLHWNWLFLITSTEGTPLCMIMHAKWDRCTTTTLEEQTLEENETQEAPQSVNCPSPALCRTSETPLGWVNRKLHAFIWTFSRASLLDKGWKVWYRGIGVVWMFQRWRYQSHLWGLKDMLSSIPLLFILETASSQHRGLWNGSASPCIDFWGYLLSWIQMSWNSWCSPSRGPHAIVTPLMRENPLLQATFEP